jgi:hypothetical protein
MKTILVIYSFNKLTKSEAQTRKRYAFNVDTKIKVGDRVNAEMYNTPIQVVEILPTFYKYINLSTGELSNKRGANTSQVEIRILDIKQEDKSTNKVVATLITDDEDFD